MDREAAVAMAYHFLDLAERKGKKYHRPFVIAADAFVGCGSHASILRETLTYFRIAGDCYATAKKHAQAAQAYVNAQMYTEAMLQYRDAHLMDEAVSILKAHEVSVDKVVADRIKNTARYTYLNEQKLECVPNVHIIEPSYIYIFLARQQRCFKMRRSRRSSC
jgi:hypothetical protein